MNSVRSRATSNLVNWFREDFKLFSMIYVYGCDDHLSHVTWPIVRTLFPINKNLVTNGPWCRDTKSVLTFVCTFYTADSAFVLHIVSEIALCY